MPEINDSITSKMSKLESRFYKMLLSNIRHDLINPINAILGYSELIIDYLDEEENGQFISDIKKIHESGSLLFKNINTYLLGQVTIYLQEQF
jgi:signal transduction histidine kinase